MAAARVLVHPRYTFNIPTNFAISSSAVMPLRVGVDTTGWVSGVLEVVVYEKAISGTGATAVIGVVSTFSCPDGKLANGSGSALATVTITDGSSTSRVLMVAQMTEPRS